MNTIESFKRNMIYISLLSSLSLSAMKTQADETLPTSEYEDSTSGFSDTDSTASMDNISIISDTDSTARMERILNVNGSVGTILHPEKINLNHKQLHIHPDSLLIGSISADNSDIRINQANITGDIFLSLQPSEDDFISSELYLSDSILSSHHPVAALIAKNSDVNIQRSRIENSAGGAIYLINENADMSTPTFPYTPDTTISQSTIIASNSYGILNSQGVLNIDDTTIMAGEENKNNSLSIGVKILATNADENAKTITNITNSKIKSYGNGIYMSGGETKISRSLINARNNYAIMTEGGSLTLAQGSELKARNNASGIFSSAGISGLYHSNKIIIDNAMINTANNTAIIVDSRKPGGNTTNKSDITLQNYARVSAGNGIALQSWGDSSVDLKVNRSHISGEISANQESTINIDLLKNAFFDGYTKNVDVFFSGNHSLWKITKSSDVGNLWHLGDIELTHECQTGSELLIKNNYYGDHGTITFNANIADDRSLPGKMIIRGFSNGNANISIKNIGGTSDRYLNRFELIHIDGSSSAVFRHSGRIVAGGYDYSLVRGQGSNASNWYLTSQTSLNDPMTRQIVRPEAAAYIANMSTANTLFSTAMNDRPAETHYTDIITGEKKRTSLWLRQAGNHNGWHDNSGQLSTQTNSTMTQLGADILRWTTNSRNRGHVGLMTGQGRSHSTSHSSVTNYHSKSSVKGYSIGTYASWYGDSTDKSGPYINSWLQYNWFNNHVRGQGLAAENYQSKGINTSFEAGYTIKMKKLTSDKNTTNSWFLQPQAQVTWMNVKARNHREANGTRVISNGEGNIQTRLGIRASLKGHPIMDKNKDRNFEPFIEANWLHNTRSFSVSMNDARVSQAGTHNIGEVKVGIGGKLNPKVNLWGNIGTQVGHKGYNNTNATVGIKYNF